MNRIPVTLLIAVCLSAVLLYAAAPPKGELDAQHFLDHVKFLSSEKLKGRGTGTPELQKAADYIAAQFRSLGFQPFEGSRYFQDFPVTTNARLGSRNKFSYTDGSTQTQLKFQEEFIPFTLSSSGHFTAGVVFVGYGITAREYGYDDYAGVDVKDKFVVVLRHEPQEYDEKSVFEGKVYTEHAQFFSKAVNAKMHGARGVIFVQDAANHTADADQLEKFSRNVGPADARVPFVQVKVEVLEKWLGKSGKTLKQVQEDIDKDLKPQSFPLPNLELDVNVNLEREVKTVHNVAGYLPGETDEYIIIGAHYDHLGLGELYSMAPSQAGTPHPGADDNASGTAGVLELARWFAGQPKQKRGILFIAFAGEELGLLGSGYYATHPTIPLAKAVAMVNMDMIGRIRDGKVYVGGMGTGTTFKQTIEEIRPRHELKFDFSEHGGYGSSDHTSFTARQVPVLFFFSGLHGDYHKPTDTWDKIDAPEAVRLLRFIGDVTGRLARDEARPQYVRVAAPRSAHASAGDSKSSGGGSGYGPYFGSIPDFAEPPTGVRFADVRDGSPAALAGLKAGDILIEFDGKKIENLYDFTYSLRAHKPGDEVPVKVIRGSETVTAKVMLTARK